MGGRGSSLGLGNGNVNFKNWHAAKEIDTGYLQGLADGVNSFGSVSLPEGSNADADIANGIKNLLGGRVWEKGNYHRLYIGISNLESAYNNLPDSVKDSWGGSVTLPVNRHDRSNGNIYYDLSSGSVVVNAGSASKEIEDIIKKFFVIR